jgi:demethylmenaquinone methyltransferase/2-methoxy-6-polyprenyl-1,4-benzoquinol methylase
MSTARTPASPSSDPGPEAWSPELLAQDPHQQADKAARVQAMFGAIARRYDLNNRLHSFGLDQRWRRRAVQLAQVDPTTDVVDVACGTGDLSEAFLAGGSRSVIGIDYTPAMLAIAREKGSRATGDARRVDYRQGDAMQLELPDASADVVSIAFGIRNVARPEKAIAEFWRILRPGGRVVILEFSEPRNGILRAANRIYTHRIMPLSATLIARDRSGAYRYLPKSVETFLTPAGLAELLGRAGFSGLVHHPLTFGVCTITVGRKG